MQIEGRSMKLALVWQISAQSSSSRYARPRNLTALRGSSADGQRTDALQSRQFWMTVMS